MNAPQLVWSADGKSPSRCVSDVGVRSGSRAGTSRAAERDPDESIRLLMIDDQEDDDTELVLQHLQRAERTVFLKRVASNDELREALIEPWDAVLCNDTMPDFRALDALSIVQEQGRDLPFIIVTGAVGEGAAVDFMRLGARDVVLRGNLGRLLPALDREIADARSRVQLRRSEELLLRSQRLRAVGEMAAGIAHDVRNLLNPIHLNAQLAERACTAETPETVLHALADIRRLVLRASETVERMRDYSRPVEASSGSALDLNALVAEACDVARPRTSSHGIPCRIDVELGSPPATSGFPGEVLNALVNLLFNAIDAMPTGGTITLRTGEQDGEAFVSVDDDGPGMRPDVAEHAFDAFFTTKGDEGTGLGLAAVQGCMVQHGGRIALQTKQGEGCGCRFTLAFPCVAESYLCLDAPMDAALGA